jgi:AraC-like DNA-binding protein
VATKARSTISVTAATGLLETIAAAGANPVQVLRAAGLELSELTNADAFISSSVFAHILVEAACATGDECFGLHFGERFDPKDIGALAYTVLNSPTVAASIQNLVRYLRIHNRGAEISFSIEGPRAYVRYVLGEPADGRRHHNEFSMAVVSNAFRMIAGSHWTPCEIQFAHAAPSSTAEHLRVFGSSVAFDCAHNALVVDRDLLDRRVNGADPRLFGILKEHLERTLGEIPPDNDLLAAVRRAIAELMGRGEASLGCVAKELAMSPRTLERRLSEQGVVFKELMDDMRRRFAIDYLKRGVHTLGEIAFLLGYSEVSAFNRAFKRWTGSTPVEYRNKTAHSETARMQLLP